MNDAPDNRYDEVIRSMETFNSIVRKELMEICLAAYRKGYYDGTEDVRKTWKETLDG